MPEIDFTKIEQIILGLEIIGIPLFIYLSQFINRVGKSEPAQAVLEVADRGLDLFGEKLTVAERICDRAAMVRGFITEHVEPGVDDDDLKAALRLIEKAQAKKLAEVAD